MIKPTVHLNGTSRAELMRGYQTACNAITDAMRAVAMAAPNGRDHYPQGNDAITQATAEHRARLRKLQEVHAELQELWEWVDG